MIRDENGLLSGYVYVDVAGRDLGSYVEEAQRAVRGQVESHLPAGYSLSWSGQYEFLQRMHERLKLVFLSPYSWSSSFFTSIRSPS